MIQKYKRTNIGENVGKLELWDIVHGNANWCSCYRKYYEVTLFCGEGSGTPLQYSCLENPMDGGAWWAAAHGVTEGRTWLSDFAFTFHFHVLEKEMATHSSVLAWRIPGTGEPCGLPSMGLHRVRHDWSDLATAAATLFWGIKTIEIIPLYTFLMRLNN